MIYTQPVPDLPPAFLFHLIPSFRGLFPRFTSSFLSFVIVSSYSLTYGHRRFVRPRSKPEGHRTCDKAVANVC